jgi:hypothetical protein
VSRVALACLLAALTWIGAGCGSDSNEPSGVASDVTASVRYDELFTCLSDLGLDGTSTNTGPWPRLIAMTGGSAVVNARVFQTPAEASQAESDFRQSEAGLTAPGASTPPPRASAVLSGLVFATSSGFTPAEEAGIAGCVREPTGG